MATRPSVLTNADINAQVAFTNSWDCTAPTGSSFTSVDASGFNYSTCMALFSDRDSQTDTCFQ